MIQVGRRSTEGRGLADQGALTRTAALLRGTPAIVPRGVFRFRTFDEADRWMTDMLRSTRAPRNPAISSASAGR
jgi:hypothetical protein